jgi:hypothetical protein
MLHKYIQSSLGMIGVVILSSLTCQAQNKDFASGMATASSTYVNQAAVLAQITNQVESIVNNGSQPVLSCAATGGSTGNDVADSEWGTIAELAFWWYMNNGAQTASGTQPGFNALGSSYSSLGSATAQAQQYQTFAQNEMNYALGLTTSTITTSNPCDIPDTGQHYGGSYYLRQVNGFTYSKYLSGETQVSSADYEETALSLVYKAMIYQYNTNASGASLFTTSGSTSQIQTMMAQAQSNWNWLAIDAAYNPQHTSNQVIAAIVGGYWLGLDIANDTAQFGSSAQNLGTAQMAAALNYYDGGLTVTGYTSNLPPPNGFRQVEIATNTLGFKFFTEHYRCIEPTTPPTVLYDPNSNGSCVYNGTQIIPQLDGFDTHYGGLQLTQMVQLINLMKTGSSLYGSQYSNSAVLSDALAEAQYSSYRLSAAGTMHGGTRHNEIGATATDITFGAGYNYLAPLLTPPADLGRNLVTVDSSTGTGHASTWGHRSAETIFLYLNWQPWVTTPPVANNVVSLRKNTVSVTFDSGNQPQEIAVNGTVMTDALRGSVAGTNSGTAAQEMGINGKAQGLQIVDSSGNTTTPAVMNPPAYYSTTNFTLRSDSGTATIPGGTANLRHIYATDGSSLYILSLVQFPNGSSALNSVSSILGIPYLSSQTTKNRIVEVFPVTGLASCTGPFSSELDLSAGAGSCAGTALKTGDVNLYAWPQIVAEDVANNSTLNEWMSGSWNYNPNYNFTLDQVGLGNTNLGQDIFYYPNSSSPVLNDTNDIRTQMQPLSGSTTYKAGDLIASVVRIAPTTLTTTMTVKTNYATGSTYNLAGCTTSPCLDVEDGTTSSGPSFTLLPSGLVTFTDKAATQILNSVGTPSFSLAATPGSLILAAGQNGAITLSLPSAGNYTGTVTFTVTGLPASITASFAPGSLVFTSLNDTKTTVATFTRSATAEAKPGADFSTPVISFFAMLFPALLGRRKARRRIQAALLSVSLCCAMGFVLFATTGCSTSVAPSTVIPVVNHVQISATDGTNTATAQILVTTD